MPDLVNWKSLFLGELRLSPNVSRAARAAGVSRQHVYMLRTQDPDFATAWDHALAESIDDLEGAAYDRAKLDSDTLAIFLLKCHRREVYGDRSRLELTGADGGPVAFEGALLKAYGDRDEGPSDDPGG